MSEPACSPATLDAFQRLVDGLTAQVAVLDAKGTILLVNQAWRAFGAANGGGDQIHVGTNYLACCERADRADASFVHGLRAVLAGTRETFTATYACHSPTQRRWFTAQVRRVALAPPLVVISHEIMLEQEPDEDVVARFAPPPLPLLVERAPAVQAELAARYAVCLEAALARSGYRTPPAPNTELRALAETLASHRAGPKDVIGLHATALAQRASDVPERQPALVREGRLLVLELMGNLLNVYRRACLAQDTAAAEGGA